MVVTGCTGGDHEETASDGTGHEPAMRVFAGLPEGLWFDAGFPPPGSKGLSSSDEVGQRWLVPCQDGPLPADERRTGAYSAQAGWRDGERYLVDTRQLGALRRRGGRGSGGPAAVVPGAVVC